MKSKLRNAVVFGLDVLVFIGLLFFACGFLPPSINVTGYSEIDHGIAPKFDKLVFMVVDAMRSDFMHSNQSAMHFVHELVQKGHCYPFTAFSDPPTVTLPRLKGLTTGSSPSFLDAVMNIAEDDTSSSLQFHDSWVRQMSLRNKSMHMYGDDTWLKLFPDMFTKFEGTTSFFVSDYTDVDLNVTHHLDFELSKEGLDSWDALILHYLGMDHIGHKMGPNNEIMVYKQAEMDAVVRRVYDSIDERTLFIVAGDHGMTDSGNHGGASTAETSAALAIIAKSFNSTVEPAINTGTYDFYTKTLQVNVVASIAYLFGLPMPLNSVGIFIPDLLPIYSEQEQSTILQTQCKSFGVEKCTLETLQQKQQELVKTRTKYNYKYMISGLFLLLLVTACSFYLVWHWLPHNSVLIGWAVLTAVYFASMFSSSSVEEEHLVWYWVLTSYLLFLFFKTKTNFDKLKIAAILAGFRIIRGYRSTGQKWAHLYDMLTFLNEHAALRNLVFIYAFIALSLKPSTIRMLTTSFVFVYKYLTTLYPLNTPVLVWLARISIVMCLMDGLSDKTVPDLLFVLLSKNSNIPLWPIMLAIRDIMSQTNLEPEYLELLALLLEFASFFALGGSNSISTVDLSNGYHGMKTYNIALVAVFTYLANWSQSLLWVDFSARYDNEKGANRIARTAFYSASCLAVCLACFVLREHLFVWTVFAPKLLYTGVWLIGHAITADIAGGLISFTASLL